MTGTVHPADRPRTRLRRRGLSLRRHLLRGDAADWTVAAAGPDDAEVRRCLEQAVTATDPLDGGGGQRRQYD